MPILLLLLSMLPILFWVESARAARVIDGDTLEVAGATIQLYGIDAPELAQMCERGDVPWPCGLDAARHLRELIRDQLPLCVERGRGEDGQVLAACESGGKDLGGAMVAAGLALADRKVGDEYLPLEDIARAQRRGLWVGRFEPPWTWRADRRRSTR